MLALENNSLRAKSLSHDILFFSVLGTYLQLSLENNLILDLFQERRTIHHHEKKEHHRDKERNSTRAFAENSIKLLFNSCFLLFL